VSRRVARAVIREKKSALEAEEFERDGVALVRRVFTPGDLVPLEEAIAGVRSGAGVRRLFGAAPGALALLEHPGLVSLVRAVLGREAFAVRSLLFTKIASANWAVHWHQDLAIAVERVAPTPGFRGWSVKGGVPHVQPPPAVLGRMVALRIHLDDCSLFNGALRVVPGSHAHGRIPAVRVADFVARESVCEAKAGDVLLMRPLLLHASSRTSSPSRRRVVHLEFAADPLPAPLRWAEQHPVGRWRPAPAALFRRRMEEAKPR
jgi:hypothetical protein